MIPYYICIPVYMYIYIYIGVPYWLFPISIYIYMYICVVLKNLMLEGVFVFLAPGGKGTIFGRLECQQQLALLRNRHWGNCSRRVKIQTHTFFFKKACIHETKKTPAASLKRRKHGLGLPIHIKYQLILIDIGYYIILVLNRILFINYIEFPSRIGDFPIYV